MDGPAASGRRRTAGRRRLLGWLLLDSAALFDKPCIFARLLAVPTQMYDEWVERNKQDSGPAWEEKEARAIGM